MPVFRYPTVVVKDAAGFYTAMPVEAQDDAMTGFGTSAKQALAQLADYLGYYYRREHHLPAPDLLDPRLQIIKVLVRPEYRVGKLLHTCEPVVLPVHCVAGTQASGLLVAALPLFDIRFSYHEPHALKNLVTRYVQQGLRGAAPRDLRAYLPPARVRLDEVVVRVAGPSAPASRPADLPVLDAVAEPLGDRGVRKQFAPAWERTTLVNLAVQKIHRERANLLLVGEPGVGKTAVLVEAVQAVERLLAEEAERRGDNPLTARRFWLTSAGRVIAGMKYLGQWEARCEELIEELGRLPGVLVVDRLLELVRGGGVGPGDSVAAFLVPYLRRGELQVVTEATPAELDACRRLLPGLADLFQQLPVPALDRKEALAVLDRTAERQSQNLRLDVKPDVSDRVYQLFRRFLPYQVFPGPAAAFVRDLCDRHARTAKGRPLTADDALTRFVGRTGLPEWLLRDEVRLDPERLLADLRRQVIGQEEAVGTAAQLVTTFKAGLNDPRRPLGVLLFCGPTGVGKTELARALARTFFGHGEPPGRSLGAKADERLIRLDMSEFAGFDAADRLLGPPDGEPSLLIRRLRQQPFRVVLFDEIEKAGPEVFDVLLSVCDEGRLTDRYGRTTTFQSSVIVFTSNLGAERREAFGFGGQPAGVYAGAVRAFFRPEFFNRLDAVVAFEPLSPDTILAITRKELAEIEAREGLQSRGLRVRWSDRLVEWLARTGFDARYGARPLQRVLELRVVAPLARFLLDHAALQNAALGIDLTESEEVTVNSG